MHGTYRTSGKVRCATLIALTALTALAVAALGYRVHRASAFGLVEVVSSVGTAALIVGAVSTAWIIRVRKLRARAEMAEWVAARLRREELLDDDADRELWDSIPARKLDEDTCAVGVNVIAINGYRRAG